MAPDDDAPDPPRRPLLGNILRLAKATSKGVEHRNARSRALRCPTCDAPRPADAGREICAYCGSRFDGQKAEDSEES